MTKLAGDGRVFLTEQPSAGVDVPGDGQVWVKDDTPNVLKFTDDAGTDFTLATESKALTTLATEQTTTSGTSIDFTGIPSGVKEINFLFGGITGNGTSNFIVQLGDSGGIEATGYNSSCTTDGASVLATNGFVISSSTVAAQSSNGILTLKLIDAATFAWVGAGAINRSDGVAFTFGGYKALSAELTQVRLTTVGGSDTFDGGSTNISYSF